MQQTELTPEIPRLSPSIAHVLFSRSPLHAYHRHRLLGGAKGKETEAMTDGKILEALIFGFQDNKLVVIDADSYRTDFAKEQREGALRLGKTPVLAPHYASYCDQAGRMLAQIANKGIKFNGTNQDRVIWNNGTTDCSGQLDHLQVNEDNGEVVIYDLKCVDDASPAKIQRKIVDFGYDIQRAAYIEALETIEPLYAGRVKFRFIFAEKDAPYAVTVADLAGNFIELGKMKWEHASRVWAACLKSDVWPAYESGVTKIEALPWQMAAAQHTQE